MIHKNDSQKWLTKMICKIIHKNQSYKKDSRKIIQKRFTNMRLTKMIHRDDTNIKETQKMILKNDSQTVSQKLLQRWFTKMRLTKWH